MLLHRGHFPPVPLLYVASGVWQPYKKRKAASPNKARSRKKAKKVPVGAVAV